MNALWDTGLRIQPVYHAHQIAMRAVAFLHQFVICAQNLISWIKISESVGQTVHQQQLDSIESAKVFV